MALLVLLKVKFRAEKIDNQHESKDKPDVLQPSRREILKEMTNLAVVLQSWTGPCIAIFVQLIPQRLVQNISIFFVIHKIGMLKMFNTHF